MNLFPKIFCLFLSLFLLEKLNGQENFYFSSLGVKDGLSHSFVTSISQDRDGYLWFSTADGLNKFDGYQFRIYRKSTDTIRSLSDNDVLKTIQDTAGHIWVLTAQGLDRIDSRTDRVSHYRARQQNFKEIFLSVNNRILAFTNKGVYQYSPEADSLSAIKLTFSIPSSISVAITDREGRIYIGTDEDGIFICDPAFRLIHHIRNDTSVPGSLSKDIVRSLLIDHANRLWITLDKNGIECYDLSAGRLHKVPASYYEQIGHHIRTAIEWDSTHLLLATFNGLVLLNKNDLTLTPIRNNLGEKGGLSHYSVYSLYKDRQQTLWVGTFSGGLNYHNRYNNRFKLITPRTFSGVIGKGEEDRNGVLWFATEGGGLLSYNPRTGDQRNYYPNPSGTPYYNNLLKTVLIAGDSIYCTAFGGKVYLFLPRTGTFRLAYDFGYNDINTLFRDSRGRLWIPTHTKNGLFVAEGQKLRNEFGKGKQRTKVMNISTIRELPGEQFLFGTRGKGVYLYDLRTDSIRLIAQKEFGLPENKRIDIADIHIDPENVWIATNGLGLWQFDQTLKLKKHYDLTDGLVDQQVYYITHDQQDNLWVMTRRELYQFNPNHTLINRFNAHNGIGLQEFSIYSGTNTHDGKLYLSGMNSLQCINPAELWNNTQAPPVLLTTLRINNREVGTDTPGSPLSSTFQQTDRLVLKHDQTNISIGYTALNYIYPEQNQYAYRMEGIDPEWNHVGNRREAFYSNLKPGRYHFQVIASNNDGVWNQEGRTLEIEVLPPYWLRWWAYLVYLSAAVFLIWQFTAWRHRKHQLENQLRFRQLEQEKQEEIIQERNRFFTHITHEFRTPLTLILNPIDDLLGCATLPSENRESIQLIRKNAGRLLSLVNNLMDIQKRDSGKKELHLSRFNFREFMQEMYYNFQATAPGREISFRLQVPKEDISVTYDRNELEKVIFNLLSNAFKFTPPGGNILLGCTSFTHTDDPGLPEAIHPDFTLSPRWLLVSVRDSGIGIREEDARKLFEPFYQSADDLHQKAEGSGIGLSLSRQIVEQHKGQIFARPLPGGGSEFGVIIPHTDDPAVTAEKEEILYEAPDKEISADEKPTPDITVLVAEDNADILSYLAAKLREDYRVLTATNGREALDIASREFPDILVSDIMMPVMNGVELCQEVKANLNLSHIPVILLTAKSMAMHMEEGFNAGADDYIVKPFSLSLLKVRIRNLLTNRTRIKEAYLKRFSLENIGIRIESVDDNFMNRYIDTVSQYIDNPNLDVDTICREMGMSRANFYRKIKAISTLSPTEMIRNIRLENAAILLKEKHLSISEIAFRVGFSNHSYFTSCFRNLYGLSPKEYQENQQEQKAGTE